MLWVVTGLFYGLFMGFYTYINQNNKINGYVLGFWRGFGVAFACFPLVLIVPFEWDWLFFLMLTVQGIMTGFYDSRIFFSSAKFGAAGTSRVLVLSIMISMVLWWLTHPDAFLKLWNKPFVLSMIIVSVFIIITSYLIVLKNAFSKQVLIYMFPAVIVLSLMSSLTQLIMRRHNLSEGIVYYLFYVTLISGVYNACFYCKTQKKSVRQLLLDLLDDKVMYVGFLVVFFSALLIISKSISLNYAPNTGYVNALSLTSPLWIMFYNHVIHHKDYGSPKAGLCMIFGILMLCVFANL
jgi:hypothetical protein